MGHEIQRIQMQCNELGLFLVFNSRFKTVELMLADDGREVDRVRLANAATTSSTSGRVTNITNNYIIVYIHLCRTDFPLGVSSANHYFH